MDWDYICLLKSTRNPRLRLMRCKSEIGVALKPQQCFKLFWNFRWHLSFYLRLGF